jgi:hypothetical protein
MPDLNFISGQQKIGSSKRTGLLWTESIIVLNMAAGKNPMAAPSLTTNWTIHGTTKRAGLIR